MVASGHMRERLARYLRRLLGIEALSLAVDVLSLRVALLEKRLALFTPPEDIGRRHPGGT